MIGEHLLFRGLLGRFVARGVPLDWATQIAGACYPGGAKKEHRKTGFVFAPSLITKSHACAIAEKLLAMPLREMQQALLIAMEVIFGRQQVESWLDEAIPDREASKEVPFEEEYRQALEVFGFRSDPTAVQLQARFKELMQQNHPDRYAGATQDIRQEREEQTKRINWAVEVLRKKVYEAKPEPPVGEEKEHAAGGVIVAPPTRKADPASTETATPERSEQVAPPPAGPPESGTEPISQGFWPKHPLALAWLLLLLAVGGVLALRPPQVAPSPPATPSPASTTQSILPPRGGERTATQRTRGPEEVRLQKAIESAKQAMAARRYGAAVDTLASSFAIERPDSIRDRDLWVEYIELLGDARTREYRSRPGIKSEEDAYQHWKPMHDVGLAWHYLMKQGLAEGNSKLAADAFHAADRQYMDVLTAVRSLSLRKAERWRGMLYGFALENLGTIREQFTAISGDEPMRKQAREYLEECRLFYAELYGPDSEQYRRVYERLAKLGGAPRDR